MRYLGLVIGLLGIALTIASVWLRHTNELGLSEFDLAVGGRPDVQALRENSKAVAEAFLAQRKPDLIDEGAGLQELRLDYAKTSVVQALGYRSSFYYYCWDIYLPYSMEPKSGAIETVIVQLSDSIPGNGHDPHRFHVVRAISLDGKGRVVKSIEAQNQTRVPTRGGGT